ncbi:MAG: hypothetical protein ACOY82_11095 [Pseudomonadota bacterium]
MSKFNAKFLSITGGIVYLDNDAFTGIAFAVGDSGIVSPAQYFDGRQVELTASFGGVPYGDVQIVDRGCVYQGDYNSGPGIFDDALYSGIAIEFDQEGCRCIREELFSNGESVLEVEYDEACSIRSWSGFIDSRFAMSYDLDAKNEIRRFSLIDPDSVEDRVYIDLDSDGGVYNIFLGRIYKEEPALVSRSMSLSGLRRDWIGRFPLSSRLLLGGKSMDDDFIDQVMANPTFSNVKEISFSNTSVSERVMERLSGRVNIGV